MSTKKNIRKFAYEMQHPWLEDAEPLDGGDYLFLNEVWHVDAWVNGGEIPIRLASTYLDSERRGTKTPDENLIHVSPVDISEFRRNKISLMETTLASPSNINGKIIPPLYNVSIFEEDGIILSFSKRRGGKLAKRLDGKKACVRILDINLLKKVIDDQLDVEGKLGACGYTHDHQRGHFLKSIKDSWQAEIRMFWPLTADAKVTLPPGIAEFVECF